MTQCAVFLSAPRFDHDYVIDLKLVPLDAFAAYVYSSPILGWCKRKYSIYPKEYPPFRSNGLKVIFIGGLLALGVPIIWNLKKKRSARRIYNELMLRFIVGYSNFEDEDIYRTGFSQLLAYADFQDAKLLASSLSLFENMQGMRRLLKECKALDRVKYWIGDDLAAFISNPNCSVLAVPYSINFKAVGAAGILGPTRMPYRELFHTLRLFSECVSETLTRNIYKFKISFRQPETGKLFLEKGDARLIGQSRLILLEDKRTINQ